MGELIHFVGHGLVADDIIKLGNLVGGTGLTENEPYYVLAAGLTADDFKVSLTSGGAAIAYTTDITDGVIVGNDVYEVTTDGIMEAPSAPATPSAPTVASEEFTDAEGHALVRMRVTHGLTPEAKARNIEVQITREYTGGTTPVWTDAAIHSLAPGVSTFAIAAIGGVAHSVRVRFIDVYGQTSSWSTETDHTTAAGADSAAVTNVGATVVIDDTGIIIEDGALTFLDQFGANAITGGGFGPSWRRFISRGLYNGDFAAEPPTPASNLNASTNVLPSWPFFTYSGAAITAKWTADATQGSGGTVRFTMAAGAAGDDAVIYQIVPINSTTGRSRTYRAEAVIRSADTGLVSVGIRGQFLAADAIDPVGSPFGTTGRTLDFIDAAGGYVVVSAASGFAPPADAAYLAVEMYVKRDTAATGVTCVVDFLEATVYSNPAIIDIPDSGDPDVQAGGISQQSGIVYITAGGGSGPRVDLNSVSGNASLQPVGDGSSTLGGSIQTGGTSFPSTPATNDLYYRTDLDMLFAYDGTRWLCACPHDLPITNLAAALSATSADTMRSATIALNGGSDIWLESLNVLGFNIAAGTALSGSHKWTIIAHSYDGGFNTLATYVINSGANGWRVGASTAIDALMGSGKYFLGMNVAKTGTPGNILFYASISYRIVAA